MTGEEIDKKIKIGLWLNSGFMVFELAAGLWSGSLALVSDAIHNFTDSLSLLISFAARRIAGRKETAEHTFGYGKSVILAALINSSVLVILAGVIFYKAIQRVKNPASVEGGVVMVVAVLGIAVNGGIAWLFRKYQHDLNIKGAYLNMFFDTLASVGALLAGLFVKLTGNTMADPVIGMVIGAMLLFSAFGIIDKAVHILLEGVPENISTGDVQKIILAAPGVKGLDNFHIWTVSSGLIAMSCHIIVENRDLEADEAMLADLKKQLADKFNIRHCTIELGLTPTPPHEHN